MSGAAISVSEPELILDLVLGLGLGLVFAFALGFTFILDLKTLQQGKRNEVDESAIGYLMYLCFVPD